MDDQPDKFVALLRGVNVGGANKVAMADLRALASALGWDDVKSYIASGNLVFNATGQPEPLASQLRSAMANQMGVDVPILILPAQSVRSVTAACPFEDEGNRIHLFICETTPCPNEAIKNTLIAADETIVPQGRFIWFHAPSGVARSKLFAKMETVLGVPATARNLNTMRKLSDMVDDR